MPDVKPVSTTFLSGQVMVLPEMSTVLPSRIYKNGAQPSASGAAFSGDEWSIPRFRAKISHFTSKIVEHSRYLPYANGQGVAKNRVQADMWLNLYLAEAKNDQAAITYRSELEKTMSPQQLEEAQALARAWAQQHPGPKIDY
jgi:hypothetical protein